MNKNNSWVIISKDIKKIKIYTYCNCGDVQIIKSSYYSNDINYYEINNFLCYNCSNDLFLSLDAIKKHKFLIHEIKNINFKIESFTTENGWGSAIYLYIPYNDKDDNNITFKKELLGNIFLNVDGKMKTNTTPIFNNFNRIDRYLDKLLNNALLKEISSNMIPDLKWLFPKITDIKIDEVKTFQMIKYFLKNKHQSEIEFFLLCSKDIDITKFNTINDLIIKLSNNYKAKSIKKIIYNNVQKSIEHEYDIKSDFIITRSFDDVNLIVKLLENDLIKEIFENISTSNGILFLRWLQKFYSQKLIVKTLMKDMDDMKYLLWRDIFRMIQHYTNYKSNIFNKYFKKVKFNADNIHNELVRIGKNALFIKNNNYIFKYEEYELAMQGDIEHLRFILPKDYHELSLWGEYLHNCIAGYSSIIKNKTSIIYGVFISSKLAYAIEIKNNKIVQAKAKYNGNINNQDMLLISAWAKKLTIKKEY
ncbi:PcfJ domain-containing protein [Sulfurimonas sp. NW15]|uniref:PcfJ domain-containing protein n=1 Tax=Sulfurimonas sp. NW15 TaxID=2922729 RepID=UPI003DA9A787